MNVSILLAQLSIARVALTSLAERHIASKGDVDAQEMQSIASEALKAMGDDLEKTET